MRPEPNSPPTTSTAPSPETPLRDTRYPERSESRRIVLGLVTAVAVGLSLGATLRIPTLIGANDISRWCTIWALVEQGTYRINDCPWQSQTQDKIARENPDDPEKPDFYSSKPPLLPTLIAGIIAPFRAVAGVPLDAVIREQERTPRRDRPDEKPEPIKWQAHVYYFKPVLILLNIVPLWVVLILYARFLDRHAGPRDWPWMAALTASALAMPWFSFLTTLNNHTVGVMCVWVTVLALARLVEGDRKRVTFAVAGFFAAFAACNELPALSLTALALLITLGIEPGRTLRVFVPAALVPIAAFLLTQYLALGQFTPAYAEFGTSSYLYKDSYWQEPLEMDALDEPKPIYFFHLTLGHHGMIGLTPVFLFALIGWVRAWREAKVLRPLLAATLAVTVVVVGYYTLKTNNYGGSTQGARWLFWLFPLWSICLPYGLMSGSDRRWLRGLFWLALVVSVMTVGYALRSPWSHPWAVDLLEHLDLYPLKR
jgi:hypothetical protein